MQLKAIYFSLVVAGLSACGGGGSVNNIVPGVSLKTPSVDQLKTAASIYLGTTKAYDSLVNTSLLIVPHYDAGFKLDDICTGGGTATLSYQDTDANQLVTKGDTYQVVFDKCVTDLGTFDSGSINSSIDAIPLLMPSLPNSTDWKVTQTLSFADLKVSEGTLTTTNNGKLSITAENKVATNQSHSSISSSYLTITSTDGTDNIALAFNLVNFDYTYNRNTLLFKMDNDITMLYSINGAGQEISYNTDPVFTGTGSSAGEGLPTAGQLIMNLVDYKPVTLIPQADGQNVSVDIADDGLNAVLMTWASLGLATAQ
jgi:hypothetical protein